MNSNREVKPIDRILKKRTVNGNCEYLVHWLSGRQQWVPQSNLRCPNLLVRFEAHSRQRAIINRYNDKLAVSKSKNYGFERNRPVEKFVGGMLLEDIPVLEVKFKDVDEHDLVLWEDAVDRYPQKVLNFYLSFFLFEQKCVTNSWNECKDLLQLSK